MHIAGCIVDLLCCVFPLGYCLLIVVPKNLLAANRRITQEFTTDVVLSVLNHIESFLVLVATQKLENSA